MDRSERLESSGARRARDGALGLLAAVALVAAAWSAWGVRQGPGSLLQIELGSHGPPLVRTDESDLKNGISAEVNGLSAVRSKLQRSLKPLADYKAKSIGAPPGQPQRLAAAMPTTASQAGVPGAPGARGRDFATGQPGAMPMPLAPPSQRAPLAQKRATSKAAAGKGKATKKDAKKGAATATKKKREEKQEQLAEKKSECNCCNKPGCGCCGSSKTDASIKNTGFFLNGNTVSRGSNVIIYGNNAKVTHSGGGVANSGGAGAAGGGGGGGKGSSSSQGRGKGSSSSQGRGKGSDSNASGKGGSGGGNSGKGSSGSGSSSSTTSRRGKGGSGGGGGKKLNKSQRIDARKKVRLYLKRLFARRTTNPNYARYVSAIRHARRNIYKSYYVKMMHDRRKMSKIKDKGNKDWVKAYRHYGHYARMMKRWYSWQTMYLIRRRRGYPKCTKKFKKCKMYMRLTMMIKRNVRRYAAFQKILRSRLKNWAGQAKGKYAKRIKKSYKRAKRARKMQKRYRRYRRSKRQTRKYARGSSKYKAAMAKAEARFQKYIDFYRGRKDRWLKWVEKQKSCSKQYQRGFRYVKYYARREMRMLRSVVNWMSKLRRTMNRRAKEYKELAGKLRARKKEMSAAYKGLYKHFKILRGCYKKGSRRYRRSQRTYRRSRKGYSRARAARRARYRRRAARNRRRSYRYGACGKRAQKYAARIDKRWKYIMGRYVKYADYWNKKLQSRKIGSRPWYNAYVRWRRNIWRQYSWDWWLIKYDSKRSRYQRKCKDLLKSTRARLKETRKARHDLRKSYVAAIKDWNKKLKSKAGNSRAAKRVRRSRRRQKQMNSWRGYWKNWIRWERQFWRTRAGTRKQRQVLYKMRKWRYEFMKFFRRRIHYYDAKVKRARKGTRVYNSRWKYSMWYRYYYLYALKRTTWFMGRQMKRLKKGSSAWNKVARARNLAFRRQLHYLKSMKWRIYKHLKVLRRGGTQRRYWYRWYRWSYTWYNRYRASWRAWKKRSASRKRRRVWRYKVGSRRWKKYIYRIRYYWYRVMRVYKRRQHYWRGRLYKYRPGSYRWRRAWNYYRAYSYRVVRYTSWYVRFLRHLSRYYKRKSRGWKLVHYQALRWRSMGRRYRKQWRHRVRYWSRRLKKTNKKGKAYKRVQRRRKAARALQKFRKTWKSWYYAMYYSYRSKVGSARFKKYYPTVAGLNKELVKFYEERRSYYKGRMGQQKSKRSRRYALYFRYYMIYTYRVLYVHFYDRWFNYKMYRRFRRNTSEWKDSRKLVHASRQALKRDYWKIFTVTRSRLRQVRRRSGEWNLWYRWYRWGWTRYRRLQGRRRQRARRGVHYWWRVFLRGKVGGDTQKRAIKYLDRYYKYVLKKYVRHTKYWKKHTDRQRLGSYRWRKYSYYYGRYLRAQMSWMWWRATFYKRWRRMYKSSSSDFKDLTKKRKKVLEERKALREGWMNTVKGWLDKIKNHRLYSWRYYNRWYSRYAKRYKRYRSPVKELRAAEHAWWKLRRSSHKDANYRAAFTKMKTLRFRMLRKYKRAALRWGKAFHKRARKRNRYYYYCFRRAMLYQWKMYIEYHRGAWFTRYAMKKAGRSTNWFKKLSKQFKDYQVGMAGVYLSIRSNTYTLLRVIRNRRSRLWRYWYRWYRWGGIKYHRYRRWYSAYSKRSATRRRRGLWHAKYQSKYYWRYYRRVWKIWLRVWYKYHRRLNYWRGRLHRSKLGSRYWLRVYYRTMRYQGRINYWIGWWINFQRKLQRVFTKRGTSQYKARSRYIKAWRRFRTAWNKVFKRRVIYWYKRLRRARKTSTASYRAVRRYYRRYGGRVARRSIIHELRKMERKVYYSKKPADSDVSTMDDLRKKYVALIDAGTKKWMAYLDKQKKGSRRYVWAYRRYFAYSYWGIREYKRAFMIASVKRLVKQKPKDWKETHDRLYALWARFNADKKGLYKRSWIYRALVGTEYWMRKRFAAFLDADKKYQKGPWPNGYCYPLDDNCKKLGVTDNLCGKCEKDGAGFKLVNEIGLRWGGKSFDDNQIGKGSIQAQNICILAKYGNKGKVEKKPAATCAGKSNYRVHGQVHWFGNCGKGGCKTCTGAEVLKDGFDWNKFASGNSCRSDSDRDYVLAQVKCYF